jgi:thioredoxin reductase
MNQATDVAIVGAGPYGLSIAAHLSALGVPFRIFGKPMENWLAGMPRGMHLKSDGFASNLDDPEGTLTLGRYCRQRSLPYAKSGLPVPLKTFCQYGLAFQRQFVPTLEQEFVTAINRIGSGFIVKLEGGDTVAARRVVVATGISHFSHMPPALAGLSPKFVSHSSAHADLTPLKGRDVVVLGGGASAIDIAALLHECGANATLVARKRVLQVHNPPSLWQRLRAPQTGIGPSWKSWFFTDCATIFHRLPERIRLEWVRTYLGPAAGWFMNDRISHVPQLLGYELIGAEVLGDRLRLDLTRDGRHFGIEADHLIAATGYQPGLERLPFLPASLRASIRSVEDTPILSSRFESSVAGLYFVGPIAANSFGPVMRFGFGAKYASRRLSRHLAAPAEKVGVEARAGAGVGYVSARHE